MKSKSSLEEKLYQFRRNLFLFSIAALLIPFILQQSFYPFFRFGMFAEPVQRKIQTEQFYLAARSENGKFNTKIIESTPIRASRLDYLLRNYYYRQETELFLHRASNLFTSESLPDTLYILRKLENDTTIVARYPLP